MDTIDFFSRNWAALTVAPGAFIGSLVVGGTIGYWLARQHYQGTAAAKQAESDATRERLAHAQEQSRLLHQQNAAAQQEVGFLVGKLASHGEELDGIRRELSELPRIVVSDRPPTSDDQLPKHTLWVTVDKQADALTRPTDDLGHTKNAD